jgi:hypothetical protein
VQIYGFILTRKSHRNRHPVVPAIVRAMLVPPKPAGWKPGDDPKPAPRPYSRREIRAQVYKYEARIGKKHRKPPPSAERDRRDRQI